jgi:hypothetical protein
MVNGDCGADLSVLNASACYASCHGGDNSQNGPCGSLVDQVNGANRGCCHSEGYDNNHTCSASSNAGQNPSNLE